MAPLLATSALLASYATEWLDLVFRWFHVTAAVVWIGTSFYFVALDNHLRDPEREEDRQEGIGGESWEIHGGGFYVIRKYLVARLVEVLVEGDEVERGADPDDCGDHVEPAEDEVEPVGRVAR